MSEKLLSLEEYSRQATEVGVPPLYVYDAQGHKLTIDVVMAGAQLRIAAAMEQANELLAEGRRQQVASASVGEGNKKVTLNANMVQGGTHVDIELDFTNPVKAATFFEDFMVHLQRMVDQVEEGGQANG